MIEIMNLRSKIAKWLLGVTPEELKSNKIENQDFMPTSSMDEMNETYVFDFLNYNGDYGDVDVDLKPPKKVKIKPIQVVNELEIPPRKIDLTNLDDKISILKDKRDLISQSYAKREISGLIERMEYRKQYNEYKDFYTQFDVTDEEKIDALLSKYKLVRKKSDIFIPEFPDAAIKVMKEYTKKTVELTGKKPVFYVIAEENDLQKAYQKRDPILLAQSPFGFFWYILGAWDKEMLLLSEL